MKTRTQLALALLAGALACQPAQAAAPKKKAAASVKKGAAAKGGKSAAKSAKTDKGAKAGAKSSAKPVLKPAVPLAPLSWRDRVFDNLATQFLNELWRIEPELAISVGKYDTAAMLSIPDNAGRQRELAFIDEWLEKFSAVDTRQLGSKQKSDLALLIAKLNGDRWRLQTLREHEWNPALYNIAEPIDLVLHTEYASNEQRLRTLLKRLANVPAYFQAAQNSLTTPTHEHTQLAIAQAPGNLIVLDALEKAVKASILTPAEKELYATRLTAARRAVDGYVTYLKALDTVNASPRPFRLGKELYEAKFAHEIQAASTAEQTFQKAQAAREELLTRMNGLADELWARTMGDLPRPEDRLRKIGMVIDKLSDQHVSREDFLPEIRRQVAALQDWVGQRKLLTLDPSKPLEVRPTPLYQRGVAGASIDAPGPYRPQDRTWYNVTPLDGLSAQEAESSLREYNRWILQILNIHEAVPGHYAQLVYANRSPSLVKSLFGNAAMIEGWAVYAERMMMEAGYGDNTPEMQLMYAKWHLRVVTNTILDYSVHVLGMDQAAALDLLMRQSFQTEAEAREKWHRVQVSSVQLCAYFSGYSEIMELREAKKKQLGAAFNLKDFHEKFLSFGSAPVKMIRELMP
ncbi:DUF885 domain-containing protein [Massilia sp. TS11]|uniref:DUF885 domain-containing protein n=1 Tax=Massilia sp. TS11 TaxID=2908003 RepID=UPI001EDC91DF|nr:DUF885 domain-containing protein [Massilia sp. TS11]MCG2585097.1 DUF885 domain-containing protein [Massilia sp. TS11]